MHPVLCEWNIPEIPLPEYIDEDQLNANVLQYSNAHMQGHFTTMVMWMSE